MSVETLKTQLEAAITKVIDGRSVSSVLMDRASLLLSVTAPYYNEDLINQEIVGMVIKTFDDNPNCCDHDMIVRDGVIYPVIMDEVEATNVINHIGEFLAEADADQAATIAFITRWSTEGYHNAKVA